MRDDQPYYYFDGYKMGQEMQKKSKEHEGHHCSGKCTKLEISEIVTDGQWIEGHLRRPSVFDGIGLTKPKEKECHHIDQTRYPINRDDIVECSECGILKPKEKECEHEWENGYTGLCKICKKCPAIKSNSDESEPFWLKVGDVIKPLPGCFLPFDSACSFMMHQIAYGKILHIEENNLTIHWVGSDKTEEKVIHKNEFKYFSSNSFKKIKLVSPAVFYYNDGSYAPSPRWYSKNPRGYLDSSNLKSVQWPAKDQFGREIWYEVEG